MFSGLPHGQARGIIATVDKIVNRDESIYDIRSILTIPISQNWFFTAFYLYAI
jgi:hypothetical protein